MSCEHRTILITYKETCSGRVAIPAGWRCEDCGHPFIPKKRSRRNMRRELRQFKRELRNA